MLAVLAGVGWFLRAARRIGTEQRHVERLSLVLVFWAVVGARAFSVLFDGELAWYLQRPGRILAVWRGGLVFYGGFLFAVAALWWYVRRHRLDGWGIADALAPALALGSTVGRLGCFASGDSYGKPSSLPWAVTFTDPRALAPTGISLHPTQLYSVLSNLLVFGLVLWLQRRRRFAGEVALAYALLYAATRSVVEVFRDDPRGVYFGDLISTSQLVAVLVAITAAALLLVRRNKTLPGRAG